VQEVKAQAADVQGKFETLAAEGLLSLCEKKGYSGVAVYTARSPAT
jgi:exodeoxyribonuclease-3